MESSTGTYLADVIIRYPANDFAPKAVFLHPYEGRALGLENYFHVRQLELLPGL